MKTILSLLTAASLAVMAHAAQAQADRPVLIHPAEFGTVREVQGDQILTAVPDAKCSAKGLPVAGGPCFDKVLGPLGAHGRVLGLLHPAKPGDRFKGEYGRDYLIYDVSNGPSGLTVRPLPYATSNIYVPRDCYALRGQGIEYMLGVDGPVMASERQLVVCDGGPHDPDGPYQPEGPVMSSDPSSGWHRTETLMLQGDRRYLAVPGTCNAEYSLKTTYCAEPAVRYMQANAGVKELDLIAARHAVQAGDVLDTSEIDQWVMKRKGSHGGFKADSRWFDKQTLQGVNGCTTVENVGWRVDDQDGLYITEQQLARCGAPVAPVPADVFEAYGEDYFIVDCTEHHGWRDHHRDNDKDGDGCFGDARGYLKRTGRSSATVVVLNERARTDDHLYDGGYITYDIANVWIDKDGRVQSERLGTFPGGVTMNGCSVVNDGPVESRGFVIIRSMGVNWARAYQWMSCPVY